uniref:NB-ARC domain-containing protein n=1 Tax=Bionectria ochroleuca TaxID=29856 RepID=A0A8H7TTR1_BIOOC
MCLLDREHVGRFPMQRGDDYVFQAGEVCGHNVVIATLPAGQPYGNGSAAALAAQIKKYFPNLWFGLLVGVAAGLPKLGGSSPRDIRLGDVLVALPDGDSAGLVAYDLGKETEDGFQLLRGGHVLAVTETVVRAAIGNIQLRAPDDVNLILPYYEAIKDKRHQAGTFSDPGQDLDQLLLNDNTKAITVEQREHRPGDQRTRIWYGPIGSGEKLLKNAKKRDELRDRYNLIGVEMAAAGATVSIPVGVIRGVCDYGDERKNKEWQPYAAAMAAAYAKAVLAQIGPHSPAIVNHIPYRRNRSFSGREVQINDLKRMIFIEGRERVAIVGLGGVGKTQIALELAYRVQEVAVDSVEEQHSVFWMPAQSLAAFQQAAIEVMQKLNLGVSDSDNAKEAFRLYLSSKPAGQWLLILDNLDDTAVLDGESDQSDSLRDFLPQSRTGRTLITTRSAQIGEDMAGSDVIELEAMSPGEARALLEKPLKRKLGASDGLRTS